MKKRYGLYISHTQMIESKRENVNCKEIIKIWKKVSTPHSACSKNIFQHRGGRTERYIVFYRHLLKINFSLFGERLVRV